MSEIRPLRVTNEYGTDVAIHGDAKKAYEVLGPKAKIVGYDGPIIEPYDGPSIADIHKEAQAEEEKSSKGKDK